MHINFKKKMCNFKNNKNIKLQDISVINLYFFIHFMGKKAKHIQKSVGLERKAFFLFLGGVSVFN